MASSSAEIRLIEYSVMAVRQQIVALSIIKDLKSSDENDFHGPMMGTHGRRHNGMGFWGIIGQQLQLIKLPRSFM